jgi:hypothetical protein
MQYLKSSIIILLSIISVGVSAELIPVGIAEYQMLYDWYRNQEITDPAFRESNQIAPFEFGDTVLTKYPFIGRTLSVGQIRPSIFFSEQIYSEKYVRTKYYESIRGGMTARPSEAITLYTDIILDEKLAKDPNYTGKKWRGLAGEIANGFINYKRGRFDFTFGRFVSNWGSENGSLVLASTARAMDGVAYRFRWGFLSYAYQLGQLDRLETGDSLAPYENRYFAGHRLDLNIFENLKIGFFETVIYGGVGRTFDLAYLNPLMIYHTVQLNEGIDDNTFIGCDFSYFLNDRYKFYGQLLIDDYQIEKEKDSDKEPNEIGYQLGIKAIDIFKGGVVDLEYRRITNRTYNQEHLRNRYLNRGVLLGDTLGPDADCLTLRVAKWFGAFDRLQFSVSYQRRGEGRYNSPWDKPWLDSTGEFHEKFPTGVVEKKGTVSLGFIGFIGKTLYLDCEGGIRFYRNLDNIKSDNRTVPFFRTRLTAFWGSLLNIN